MNNQPDSPAPNADNTPQSARTDAQNDENLEAALESTQEKMGSGVGIRGDYGNSDQTNGMEGAQSDDELPATKAERENKG